MADVVAAFQGWNSSAGGWGDGPWGGDAALPGLTGAVGTVTVDAAANVPTTGLQATGSVGSVTVTADANISPSGLQATGGVGSATITSQANVSVTGLAGTGGVGSATRS